MGIRAFGVLIVGLLTAVSGCGSPAGTTTPDEVTLTPPTGHANTSAQPKPEENTQPPEEDTTATQATAFCVREIETSASQAFEQLDKKQISACLIALRPAIVKDCASETPREVIVKIIIADSGTVTGAFAVGDTADTSEAACVVEKVKAVRFPAFTAMPQQIVEKFPFKVAR